MLPHIKLLTWIWLFSLALGIFAWSMSAGQQEHHYLVHTEQELRSALEDPEGLARDELVIRIGASLADIRRPIVYDGEAHLRLTGDQHLIASYGRCRVLHIRSPVRVTIHNLTIADGRTGVGARRGGGIYLQTGSLKIIDSAFINNGAEWGGAVYANGCVEVRNSRFESNTARWKGGAVYSTQDFCSTNSTYTNNTTPVIYVANSILLGGR